MAYTRRGFGTTCATRILSMNSAEFCIFGVMLFGVTPNCNESNETTERASRVENNPELVA